MNKQSSHTFVLSLITLVIAACSQADTNQARLRDTLLALDQQVDAAFLSQDTALMGSVLDDTFTWVHAGAKQRDSKADTLHIIANHPLQLERDAMDIRVFGNAALVSGYVTFRNSAGKVIGRYHVHRTYIDKQKQTWQLVYQHVNFDLDADTKSAVKEVAYERYWSTLP